MRNAGKLCALLALLFGLFGLSGCAGYSHLVNSAAPAKPKSDMVADAGASAQKSSGVSPFCEEPAPPAKAPIQEVYMVMPEDGGKAGTVAVTFNDGREVVLHGDYSAMSLAGDERKAYVADQAQMLETFGTAVAALPKAPLSATLYFLLGKDQLTPQSRQDAETIYGDFVQRQAPEVLIVGHTDTVGSAKTNQTLSERRAEKVRQGLIVLGVPSASIQASGRGERELLVATPDNTKEPRNRRVEISVR